MWCVVPLLNELEIECLIISCCSFWVPFLSFQIPTFNLWNLILSTQDRPSDVIWEKMLDNYETTYKCIELLKGSCSGRYPVRVGDTIVEMKTLLTRGRRWHKLRENMIRWPIPNGWDTRLLRSDILFLVLCYSVIFTRSLELLNW